MRRASIDERLNHNGRTGRASCSVWRIPTSRRSNFIRKGARTATDREAIRPTHRHGILSMANWVVGFARATTARPKVPMHRIGADCSVVASKRVNARGAKRAGHRHWLGSTGNGRNPMINGRRQPSRGGTSRISREAYVRFCEGLEVKFPGPTRRFLSSRAETPHGRFWHFCTSRGDAVMSASGREAVCAGRPARSRW